VSTIWLSSILSQGDHRMVHVEPWVAKRLWTLVQPGGKKNPFCIRPYWYIIALYAQTTFLEA